MTKTPIEYLKEKNSPTAIGYKVMRYENGKICSLADNTYQFTPSKNKTIKMDGDGVWLSTNKQFVLDYYSNSDEDDEVLVTLEFNKDDITRGNLEDREPVITVPKVKIKSVHHIVDYNTTSEIDFENKKKKLKP